ncbi:TPA: DUF4145 domain-containing protein [Serratia marcescens]
MGMVSFDTACPHCLREKAVLVGLNESRRGRTEVYDVHFYCRSCDKSGIAVVASQNGYGPLVSSGQNGGRNIVIPNPTEPFVLFEVYPRLVSTAAPGSTPARAAAAYVEAKENIQRGRYDTAVMLCRKVIDIATRVLLGDESKDEKLVKRISMLHAKELITVQMKDWAHIVRIDSNGAVHSDEEFTQEEAEEMIGFTEVFLIYSFTLPEMVSAKQHKPEE